MIRTGGELLLDVLQACGVEKIFCSPGTEWAPVWEGLARRQEQGNTSLTYINCRHEMLAVSMAQGYAETSGRIPAVLLHAGVGPLHGAMAIRNACAARAPMIIMGGETSEHWGDEEIRPQGFHWLGLLSDIGGPAAEVRNYVKWSNRVQSHDALVDSILRGYEIAAAAPRGPCFISVPAEVLLRQREFHDVVRPVLVVPLPVPAREDLAKVARQLLEARNPVIISEQAGKNPGVTAPLVALAELLTAPVYESMLPYASAFPRDHPLFQGMDNREALRQADAVLVLGGLTPWYPPKAGPGKDAHVIFLDEAPHQERLPHWGYRSDTTIAAEIEPTLKLLADIIGEQTGGKPVAEERKAGLQQKHDVMVAGLDEEAVKNKDAVPISPRWFVREARAALPDNAMIVDETIMHTRSINQYAAQPGHYIKAAYGGLGVGFGEALGVKLAHPEQPVVLMVGDGAFNYNPVLAGLGMSQEYGVPIFVMIFNNGGYKAMGMGHRMIYPEGAAIRQDTFYGVDITPAPDYAGLAQAFGAYGEKLESPSEIRTAIGRGLEHLAAGKTVVLDVVLGEHVFRPGGRR
ncbi:MAG: thiamine pyrophosphate-binding protein [Dehalococcoidales bacterium]|nr:thiamine pyrophosphate-binding protein [Dehalococcoidales bacterium]